ncbi:TPA: DUF4209 domain-containing protein [Vibrio parahaemolyticus]|nr:DUF4209 domain-containing protein [Vibrio parahaemolyticus]ELJ8764548.1 DUF4209 domain-containing protein [Vibrio parahaemolyticus]ELZ5235616.1 DUF4209 domain-containing protein [Vibrio parahaemolyticus]MBE3685887.1 DUF4209 domain-containing protein [Vibrio parahaemolyticus]MBE5171032.1 DUF4209 domain-containing protein [Vibrio parahaemolyticus]MBM5179557.1 DUF4209 domain-containing protein [Vibrio parahaemolyticus]
MDKIILTNEDINTFNWDLINNDIICTSGHFELDSQSVKMDVQAHRYLTDLIAKIAKARGEADDNLYPYRYYNDKKRLLDSLSPSDIEALKLIGPNITDPVLSGRIYDIIWLKSKPRDKADAQKAIESYKKVHTTPDNFYIATRFCLARAIALVSMFRDSKSRHEIESILCSLLEKHHHDLEFYYQLLNFCDYYSLTTKDDHDVAIYCFETYERALCEQQYDLARRYCKLAEKKFKSLKDTDNANLAIKKQADAWRIEAESRSDNLIFVSNELYGNAIQTYLKIPNSHRSQDTLSAIESCKLKRQKQSEPAISQLPTFSDTQDVSDLANLAIDTVKNKSSVQHAISAFCGLPTAINKEHLIKMMETSRTECSFLEIFGGVFMAQDGRVVAHTHPQNLDAPVTEHNLMDLTMFSHTVQHNVSLIVQGMIIPALHKLNEEHHIDGALLRDFCEQAPLIDSDRTGLTSKALLAGFNLDFDLANHVLVPQIEHFVRSSLKKNDVVIHTSEQDNTEELSTLNYMLFSIDSKETFEENLLFEMQVLFGDKKGFNARNDLAHGVLNDGMSMSTTAVYIWWRYLKLCLGSIFME